ncbi:hypothetical protein MVEG_11159 [Podila verticillata NRRL 6337]|uniref:Uncharacterized protein n=1 Tax=Podila verticillata NRRL 6337 TaxID=1069443 RepID=A0A086TME5_9FUNG|nr:hypothetical protein MVEG_11159 [Podila verticillata NRRL 6337]
MHPSSHFHTKLLVFLLCTLFSLHITPTVHAQAFVPVTTYNSASVFIEGKAFYIQSGISSAAKTLQAFSIDLSKSWNVTNPLYTKMQDGIFSEATPNALLSDGESWFLVANTTHSATYNVRTGAITYKASTFAFNTSPGLRAATDPEKDNIIIPNGAGTLPSATAVLNGRSDTSYLTLAFTEIPPYGYSIAWSASAKTAFFVGGLTGGLPPPFFGRWVNSVNGTWQRINTAEDPSGRDMACMVPAYNGTKLILYGGRTNTTTLSDIYVYDVLASKWTQGSPGGLPHARSSHACAVSGDYFIGWGGVQMAVVLPSQYTSVYNLVTNTWVDRYEAPPSKPTTSAPKPTATTMTSSGSTSSPSVPTSTSEPDPQRSRAFERYGIPIIAVVAVAVAAGLLFWLYRRNKAKKNMAPLPSRAIIPLDRQYDNDKNNNYIPPPNSSSPHFPKPPLAYNTKQEFQQHAATYTAPLYSNNGHSPESACRQPQGNEVQAHELLLKEYEGRRQRQLEEQRDLEQRIERHRTELQMIKDQQRESSSTQGSTPSLDRRGPQYWSMGSSGDRELPDAGWSQPQQTRGAQLYRQSRLG